MLSSDEPSFVGGQHSTARPAPANIRLQEEVDTEEPNSVEKGAHLRKAPAPVRVCFAGAGKSAESVPPTRFCSPEDRVRIRAQLRLTFACMRKTNTE